MNGANDVSLKKKVLQHLLRIARVFGLFKLARRLTRGQLRILAYHGIAMRDEDDFRGGLFMSPETFKSRMRLLSEQKYPVLDLGEATEQLRNGKLPPGATVITIDDGWAGTAEVMAPVLAAHEFPSTLYLCTYYMQKGTQVFNVTVDYVLWSSTLKTLPVQSIGPVTTEGVNIDDPESRLELSQRLSAYADSMATADERQSLLAQVCKLADVDFDALVQARIGAYMNADEVKSLEQFGMDVQLHTHRHCTPSERESLVSEIEENRRAIAPLSNSKLVHHCYPSGEYSEHQIPWLKDIGIETATTVTPGFNSAKTDRYQLQRFLDWEQISLIEFEAEMSGILELIRRLGIRI